MPGYEYLGLAYRHGMHTLRDWPIDRRSYRWRNSQAWVAGSANANRGNANAVHSGNDRATRTEGWLAGQKTVLEYYAVYAESTENLQHVDLQPM
jgi:hypothetical protein